MARNQCSLSMLPILALTILSMGRLAHAQSEPRDPPLPANCTYKVLATPDFFQEDPRGHFPDGGRDICAPTSVSDSFMYLATHGFERLLPPNTKADDQTQINLIDTLLTKRYLRTARQDSTSPSNLITGVRQYVMDCGYVCKRLEYMGSQALGSKTASAQIGSTPDINWIKAAVANPNCCVWLRMGYYKRGSKPGQWIRGGHHTVAVVGYETGSQKNAIPTELLIHNPDRQLDYPPSTPATMLTDDVVYLTPMKAGELDDPQNVIPTTSSAGHYFLWGPGLLHNKGRVNILEGAFVLEIAKPGS